MHPILVTPPQGDVVSRDDAKDHCSIDLTEAHFDSVIDALLGAAVSYLDGWHGVLGRAILEQQWSVTVPCAGDWVLPMPDISAATVDYGTGATALAVTATAAGPQVTVTGACTIVMTCAMEASMRARAELAVKFLVAHWFRNREAVVTGPIATNVPLTAEAIIDTLRWRRLG